MGGDYAPLNCVVGAVQAQRSLPNSEIMMIGKKEEILAVLQSEGLTFPESQIIHASEVIEMCDVPTQAIKNKKDSSIVVGCKMVKERQVDAFVSAGNTGAMMAASTLIIGRIKGVGRPTMGTFFPSQSFTTIFDVGASVDSKPRHLVEYALMGSIFAREIYGIENPKVGLLSVGEEETKGNEVVLETHAMLKKSNVNFIGNIEGRDILKGTAHVVVCDGFVGNIVLKFGEGVLPLLKHLLKEFAETSLWNKIRVGISKGVLKGALKSMDYQQHGGVPLLGVDGISLIGHGSSTALAIKNMIIRADEMYRHDIVGKIRNSINELEKEG
ncbi:MAG: phosphate acyltransferase PlsX [Ignavibacteria bacterium]|nr:phosphate acyltransferase PlsX [Ignavibacteria bacterium]